MSEPESPMQSTTRRPMWLYADNGERVPVVRLSVVPCPVNGASAYVVRPGAIVVAALPAQHTDPATDLHEWARRWRECGGSPVDVLPWADEVEP